MSYDLKEKVVLITGGAVGIGARVIEYLLEEGVKHVAFLDILEEQGVVLRNKLTKRFGIRKVTYHNCNVLDEEQLFEAIQAVKDEFGYIDIVINNAGIMNDSIPLYKKEIALNVTTPVTLTLKSIEWMRKDKGGKGGAVVNISSVSGLMQESFLPIYFATKSAVLQFSNCIGMPDYYNKTGVRVVTICFGPTETALISTRLLGSFDEDIHNNIRSILETFPIQQPESAAKALVNVIKVGESGSTWLAVNDQPVKEITESVKKAYSVLKETFVSN